MLNVLPFCAKYSRTGFIFQPKTGISSALFCRWDVGGSLRYPLLVQLWTDPTGIVSWIMPFRHLTLPNGISSSLQIPTRPYWLPFLRTTLARVWMVYHRSNFHPIRYSYTPRIFYPLTKRWLSPFIYHFFHRRCWVCTPSFSHIFSGTWESSWARSTVGFYCRNQIYPRMTQEKLPQQKRSDTRCFWQQAGRQKDRNQRWFQAFFCTYCSNCTKLCQLFLRRTSELKNCRWILPSGPCPIRF